MCCEHIYQKATLLDTYEDIYRVMRDAHKIHKQVSLWKVSHLWIFSSKQFHLSSGEMHICLPPGDSSRLLLSKADFSCLQFQALFLMRLNCISLVPLVSPPMRSPVTLFTTCFKALKKWQHCKFWLWHNRTQSAPKSLFGAILYSWGLHAWHSRDQK